MSYGSNDQKPLNENNYFQAGINQNVTINAEFRSPKKDGTGDKILCIDITGSKGEKFTVTEWPAKDGEDDKVKNQLTRLRRWVKEVTGEDNFPVMFTSFEDMATQFCTFVNGKGTLLEFKLLYGTKYLEMPKYDNCVRSMSNSVRLTLSTSESAKLKKPEVAATPVDDMDAVASSSDLDF